jgi:hypothetical protein
MHGRAVTVVESGNGLTPSLSQLAATSLAPMSRKASEARIQDPTLMNSCLPGSGPARP